ncbi:hypothetical protein, partial [Endozoicomonas sp. SESOKO1]|uniref:hypothetical protein n=1 Tax=Endozoicomonas sp. SESOKO1 TaxID=2828742 RepID=UPI0021497933
MDKLLRYRNSIAHGETSLPVELITVNEFVELVNELMDNVASLPPVRCRFSHRGLSPHQFMPMPGVP